MTEKKEIFHVVAMAQNKVIGKDNHLPWHFSADLKFFKQLTMENAVIMGRKTFESIVERLGKPLPNRKNIVLTRQSQAEISSKNLIKEDWFAVGSMEEALKLIPEGKKGFIIGGAEVYRQTIDKIDGIYLTKIHQDFEGDAFYPGVPAGFKVVSCQKLQDNPLIEILFYQADQTQS